MKLIVDAYTDKEYVDLMDRFKDEGIPLSVGVIDMDWWAICNLTSAELI